jgi:hypothetical protein
LTKPIITISHKGNSIYDQDIHDSPSCSQPSLANHNSSEHDAEANNDDYIHHLLSGITFKCCGCEGNPEEEWQKLRHSSQATFTQQDLSSLTCENCARAPCSKCAFSLSNSGAAVITPGRILVPYEPLDRRIYIFLCDSCGKAKEILSEPDEVPTIKSVPLPRGRRLSFTRNVAAHDTKFYANLDKAKCHDCNHKSCKRCVFFDAFNRWGGGKGGQRARRASRAGSIVKAIASAAITDPESQNRQRSNSRFSRKSTPEHQEPRCPPECDDCAGHENIPTCPSRSTGSNQSARTTSPARSRHSSRRPSPSPAGSRMVSKKTNSSVPSSHRSASNFQGGGPDLDIGAALHRRDTEEDVVRGGPIQQSPRHHRVRAPAPEIVPLKAHREDGHGPPSIDKPISPVDPNWKDDGIQREISTLVTDPGKRWQPSQK